MKALPAIAALALVAALNPASAARLVPPPPPHTPAKARCALQALIAAIDRRDRAFLSNGLKIYSDTLGEVTPDEFDRFFAEFAATAMRNRGEPLELRNWGVLQINEVNPLYVMSIRRGAGDGNHWSAWLVQFGSDDIRMIRRADELWPFATGSHFFSPPVCPEAAAR